ncbi:MAG TPA: fused MFS/spermidine synthase [Rhizomicrobium sp.]|nr:fused MFS/spermidine synthase [Rhizomicrobium sp.]
MAERKIIQGAPAIIYANVFLVGGVLMGFEMLGSRYLYPYFGGGIGTWASLISTVLLALALGYFAGGKMADRLPSTEMIAGAVLAAAVYLACVPVAADRMMTLALEALGDGPGGILPAAAAIILVPVSLLGMLSPVAIRLLTRSTHRSGSTAGLVYGISTVGNVIGTLFTTFFLIPAIGSREITYVFAGILALCSLSLFLVRRPHAVGPKAAPRGAGPS